MVTALLLTSALGVPPPLPVPAPVSDDPPGFVAVHLGDGKVDVKPAVAPGGEPESPGAFTPARHRIHRGCSARQDRFGRPIYVGPFPVVAETLLDGRVVERVADFGYHPIDADGQAVRCRSRLVEPGDPRTRVVKLCGEPNDVVRRTHYATRCVVDPYSGGAHPTVVAVSVEEWYYDFGPHRLTRTLAFHDGRLLTIEDGKRGLP
jgi:hypothetical protein